MLVLLLLLPVSKVYLLSWLRTVYTVLGVSN